MNPSQPTTFTRNEQLNRLHQTSQWDVVVIGGGATGLGIAVDAASRGLKTVLLEAADFAKGTSSRSTKLVHGGVRYLAQGDIGLVFEALRERGYLLKNAPHLVRKQAFIIPCYSRFSLLKYWIGLKLYDWLSVRLSFGASQWLPAKEVAAQLPGINTRNLVGGVLYYDGQFDDARLAINLAQTAADQGAAVLNYMQVNALQKKEGKVCGVIATDREKGQTYNLQARTVINATGVFVDAVLQMDQNNAAPLVRPSQGIHLVLDKHFLPGNAALMIPQTTDGRVLFALPWHGQLLVGTTDTPLNEHSIDPCALDEEIDFVLENVSRYLTAIPTRKNVQSVFAGLRPLAAPQKEGNATSEISRSHKLITAPSGLITITGGKWTTYRKMAEDAVNAAIKTGNLPAKPPVTKQLVVHGGEGANEEGRWVFYGTDTAKIKGLFTENPGWENPLVQGYPYTEAEVVWAVRHEMARTVEDVLARRLRLLFLDAKAALEAAPKVAAIMASELSGDGSWIQEQLVAFKKLAMQYLPR